MISLSVSRGGGSVGRGPPGYGALRLDRACSVAWYSSGILNATYRRYSFGYAQRAYSR
jgi:hypothetical protein